MFHGLRFEAAPSAVESAAERADVACFVGFVALRDGPVPESVREGWRQLGWRRLVPDEAGGRPARDLPVRVDNIEAFDQLFDGWVRLPGGVSYEGYLAGAVRDFFRQGGQRCFVVPVGAPRPTPLSEPEIDAALDALVPGLGGGAPLDSGDRDTWRGVGHLLGLPEVALLCLPDLPAMVGAPPGPAPEPIPSAVGVPVFAECSAEPPEPPGGAQYRAPGPPRLGETERGRWVSAVSGALGFLKSLRRDVQLLAALPLPEEGSVGEVDPLRLIEDEDLLGAHSDGVGVGSAWLQLAWPWLQGDTTADRRGGLAPPDGAFAGLLARNGLQRGTFRLALREELYGVRRLSPQCGPAALIGPRPVDGWDLELSFSERVSVVALDRGRAVVLSDVCTTANPLWRQGGVNRLMGVILRALEAIGRETVFESSGPSAWRTLRRAVEITLDGLVAEGALGGRGEAYQVRCDTRTMSQADLDAGRLVCEVVIQPTPSIERITVVLAVAGAARVGVSGARGEA